MLWNMYLRLKNFVWRSFWVFFTLPETEGNTLKNREGIQVVSQGTVFQGWCLQDSGGVSMLNFRGGKWGRWLPSQISAVKVSSLKRQVNVSSCAVLNGWHQLVPTLLHTRHAKRSWSACQWQPLVKNVDTQGANRPSYHQIYSFPETGRR